MSTTTANQFREVRPGLERRIVHVTGFGHKVHHADEHRFDGTTTQVSDPVCGSRRFNGYGNGLTEKAVTCDKKTCINYARNCEDCKEAN